MSEVKISRELQIYLIFLLLVHLFLLYGTVPHWVFGVGVSLCAWKGLSIFQMVRPLKKAEIWIIGASGILLVFLTHHTLIGEDASSMVLALTASCKLSESKDYRDYVVTLILCFLLLMVYLLGSQSLGSLAFLLMDLVLLVQFLFQLHPAGSSLFSLKAVLRLLAYTVPVWALLFFLFPRFTIGFWRHESARSSTGFSDELNPGSISQLAESDEIAFRVMFSDQAPDAEQMYWRGSVLNPVTSMKWMKPVRGFAADEFVDAKEDSGSTKVDLVSTYQLWLEPIFKRWLFLLDFRNHLVPFHVVGNPVVNRGAFVQELSQPAQGRLSYTASASRTPALLKLSAQERNQFVMMPSDITDDVKTLALQIKQGSSNPEVAATNLIRWFGKEKFYYTLDPGAKEKQTLSNFLFRSKKGFCEHYAAAGAVLLRAMGYPARVVVGFQGAELNQVGNYWIVRNRNAHAWDEVFIDTNLAGKLGYWKRVDLVSVVTPLRMRLGAAYFSENAAFYANADGLNLEGFRSRESWIVRSSFKLRMAFDSVEMQWLKFLTDYDFEQQQSFFKKLGLKDASRKTFFVLLATALALWTLGFALFQRRRSLKSDPVLFAWAKFCKILRIAGVERRANEGPSDYVRRCIHRFPQFSAELESIEQSFILMRYAPSVSTANSDELRSLKVKLAQLKLNLRQRASLSKL